MPKIQRVVIFGDSLSDIGYMAERFVGTFATINKWGRFSDGKNWVDFFWEAVSDRTMFVSDPRETKIRSTNHRSLANAHMGGGDEQMELANYAEGGATALRGDLGIKGKTDKLTANKVLSNLATQVDMYLHDRGDSASRMRVADNKTLHLLWAGANDIVTVNRDKEYMPFVAKEVVTLAMNLIEQIPGSHSVIVDLPDPQFMPRFDKDSSSHKRAISEAASLFNSMAEILVNDVDPFSLIARRSTLSLVKISETLGPKDVASHGFAPFAQTKKDKVGSTIGSSRVEKASLLVNEDIGFDEDSEFSTTKDTLHPTEGVYQLIAKNILSALGTQGYTFGK